MKTAQLHNMTDLAVVQCCCFVHVFNVVRKARHTVLSLVTSAAQSCLPFPPRPGACADLLRGSGSLMSCPLCPTPTSSRLDRRTWTPPSCSSRWDGLAWYRILLTTLPHRNMLIPSHRPVIFSFPSSLST